MCSFDNMDHEWVMKFVQHRVADPRMLRLIKKWLRAGVSEEGQWSETKVGDATRGSDIAIAGQYLSALRL